MDYTLSINQNVLSIIPASGLSYNTQYTVYLDANISGYNPLTSGYYAMDSDYSFWFTGPYCPQFTTVTRIRLEVGPNGDNLIDDTIHRMILKNSQDALELLAVSTNSTSRVPYSVYGCSWEDVPYILRRYVECKTAYDILALIELVNNSGGAAGFQLKTLGDMTIRYGGPNAASSKIDPGKKKQLYDCWMEMLAAIKALTINSAVRGWYDVSKGYPHPTFNPDHNRVIRTVDFINSQPYGPWERARYWRSNI